MTGPDMSSLKKTARIAGVLILITVLFAPFSMIYVPSTLIVPGDAASTAKNIVASEGLFRLSIVSDAIVFLTEIVLVAVLYVLLKPVNKTLSLVAAFARLAMTVIQGINLVNRFVPLLLLSGAEYSSAFEPGQLHALVLLSLNTYEAVSLIWGLFFGLHLGFLGYLVYRSGYIPRIVGGLLVFASVCYLASAFGIILLPKSKAIFDTIGFLSLTEAAFPLWLLIKGIDVAKWKKRAGATV